jgi:hypothetical protein
MLGETQKPILPHPRSAEYLRAREKQILISLFAALFVSLNAFGEPVSAEQAALMVKGWLRLTRAPLKTPLWRRTIGSVRTFGDEQGQAIYYAVPLQPEGFIIMSADTEVEPVIAFSATGSFEANPDFPLFALLQRDLPARLDAVQQQNQLKGANPTAESLKWARLMGQETGLQPKGNGLDAVDDLRVAPFIQSRWDQETICYGCPTMFACFNYYTPPYAAGTIGNYPCGCNSTAWAQIMRYFQYPTQPVGTMSFSIEVDGVATTRALRGGDGLGGPYNWNQMPLVPDERTTEEERQAIGALTADIGAASHTSYSGVSAGGSAGWLSDSELKSVFQFANAIMESGLSSRLGDEVNANMDAKLPVYLTVWSESDGHAMVCDGYGYNLSTLYHHLSLGWSGSGDAWYNLPNVAAFTSVGAFFYNIFTNGTGEIISGRVVAGNSVPLFSATVTATRAGGGEYTATTDTNGIYALVKVPSASQYSLTVTKMGFIATNASFSTGTSSLGDCGNVWGADIALIPEIGPPSIVRQPESQAVNQGSNATFNITALSQAPLSYQWQCRTGGGPAWSDLNDNASYSGSESASLTVMNANVTGLEFRCIVTNPSGSVTSSPPAVLTVNFPLVITTLAGLAGSSGSTDGTGSAARFSSPRGGAVDSAGNVYVADSGNNTIRKVTPAGGVTTLAGLVGSSGSADGTGSVARFNSPLGVAVDSAGNVYVADSGNNSIRKVTPAGGVTTLAGLAGSSGSADGTGSAARFNSPRGVAVDSAGNVYVGDRINDTIRKVTPAGVVTTLAGLAGCVGSADGTGSAARFYSPSGVAVDSAGNVYVADWLNDEIRKVTPAGVVTTLAGLAGSSGNADGRGTAARFYRPYYVAVDSAGNVYVADFCNHTIRKVTPAGVVATLAGLAGSYGSPDGTGSAARFTGPSGVAVDIAGNVYVADTGNDTIRRGFAANAAPVVVASWPSFGFNSGQFGFNLAGPAGQAVVIDASTNLKTWLTLWTNTIGRGALYFSDPQSSTYPKRFYRAHTP